MNDNWLKTFGRIGPIAILAIASSKPAFAQIIPDQTLGNENSVVVPINAQLEHIQGGALRESNLFHSFQDFNIKEGHSAYFVNPAAIQNIFSRVTGVNPSHILGKLGVLGEANLYLINPNGIIFGDNASLDINGAFVASTASSFAFPDGSQYSAINPEIPPVLINNVPIQISLQFEGEPATIVNAGHLQAGGNITLAGGMVVNTGKISAPENTVNLLAVQPKTTVQMSDRADILEVIEPTVTSELESDLEALEELSEETGLRVTETGDYEILGTGITVSPETGLTIASGEIEAAGGTVRVLGNKVGLVDTNIDVSGENGGGTVHIGGNYRGQNSLLNAERTWVNEGTNITADAIGEGDGGTAIVWADEATAFYGNISARGGNIAGDGGFVEVSGHENLLFEGMVDVDARQGKIGTLLLDPRNITISNINFSGVVTTLPDIFQGEFTGSDITINVITLEGQSGNIILEATENINIASGVNLIFGAGKDIIFMADSDKDNIGDFSMNTGDTVKTNGRNISIYGRSITLGTLDTSSIIGDGGNVILNANGQIQTDNINASGIIGDGGNVILNANGQVQTDNINASSIIGDGGNITILSYHNDINLENKTLRTDSIFGNGGNIKIEANGNILSSNLLSSGEYQGGNITLESKDGIIDIRNSGISSGNADSNQIKDLTNQGFNIPLSIRQSLQGEGNAGNISFTARNGINISNSAINISGGEAGAAGSINFHTKQNVSLQNSVVESLTKLGNGGYFHINNRGSILLKNSNIVIKADNSMFSQAGNIHINSLGTIELNQDSAIVTQNRGGQPTGNISIDAKKLTVISSGISASTDSIYASGQGGQITLNIDESIKVIGIFEDDITPSFISSNSISPAQAGKIDIKTKQLIIQDGAAISALSLEQGKAGSIFINSSSIIITGTTNNLLLPSVLSVDTATSEQAGNLIINTDHLLLETGGTISASTFNNGQGGNIIIDANAITIRGILSQTQFQSGIFAQSIGSGRAVNIKIKTDNLMIENEGKISVSSDPRSEASEQIINNVRSLLNILQTTNSSFPSGDEISRSLFGGDAGNINISANDKIMMQNRAQIVGETSSGDGGNINLAIGNLLLMRHGSKISTTAGTAQAGGDGGNITINAENGFLVGPPGEDNDITANAFEGNGGNINITAQEIFGLKFRDSLTPRSDITASSEFGLDGTVQLNTLGIDPNNGLTNLPEDRTDPEVRQGCSTGGENSSSLTVQGIGGKPDNPDDMLTPEFDDEFISFDELETDGTIAESEEEREAIAPNGNQTPILFSCQ